MNVEQTAGFGALDWVVVALYALVLIGTGVLVNRRKTEDTEDYFLGGRRMPVWAVAISVLATGLSAATFVGGPQQAYAGDLTYLSANVGMILAALVVGFFFIPAFYRARVATVYGLLDKRFGTGAKRAASTAFLLGRILASGSRVYIIGIPAALILFGAQPEEQIPAWEIVTAIAAMTAVGIVYTLVGGVASVIWSDVIQMGVFIVAIVGAIVVLLGRIPASPVEIAEVLSTAGEGGANKLTVLDMTLDLTANYSILAVFIGFTLLGIASYGADQDMVQRMLTCKSAAKGSWSVISANLLTIPVVGLFLVVGLLLFVFYQRPDVMGDAAPGYEVYDSSRIFLSFILREMPAGMSGLMMAGLFAAGLSSLNSGLNSMSSTVINDFYRELRPGMGEKHYLAMGRVGVVLWGLVLGGFACFCVFWQRAEGGTLIDFALGVMTFAYAGLLGVFFTALFTRRGSTASVVAALVVGFIAILLMQGSFWDRFGGTPGRIVWFTELAFTWKLLVGVVLSFVVCCVGSGGTPFADIESDLDEQPAAPEAVAEEPPER